MADSSCCPLTASLRSATAANSRRNFLHPSLALSHGQVTAALQNKHVLRVFSSPFLLGRGSAGLLRLRPHYRVSFGVRMPPVLAPIFLQPPFRLPHCPKLRPARVGGRPSDSVSS